MIFRRKLENPNRQTADWLARLHADDRTVQDEEEFRAWRAASSANEKAFENASGIWTAVGGLRDAAAAPRSHADRESVKMSRRAVMAGGAAIITAGVTIGWQSAYAGVYHTEIGEQRRLHLEDGTRAMLDTDTHIRFRTKDNVRLLALHSGRIDVDIAPDARPFIIDFGDRQASATQARVDVRRIGASAEFTTISGVAQVKNAAGNTIPLTSGSRLAVAVGRKDRVDQPELEDLIAWQSGRLAFRDNSVQEAVTELNRYSARALVVDADVAAMRISGVYRVGDPEAFARSLALLLPVRVAENGSSIQISAER